MTTMKTTLAFLATIGMAVLPPAWGAQPTMPAPASTVPVRDVQLNSQGQLSLRIVDSNGQSLAHQPVALLQGTTVVLTGATDSQGDFLATNLRGGLYRVQTNRSVSSVRCWAFGTAPPTATKSLFVAIPGRVTRGQCNGDGCEGCELCCEPCAVGVPGPEPFCSILGHEPLMIGLLVAAAIAIPIAVHDSGDDAS